MKGWVLIIFKVLTSQTNYTEILPILQITMVCLHLFITTWIMDRSIISISFGLTSTVYTTSFNNDLHALLSRIHFIQDREPRPMFFLCNLVDILSCHFYNLLDEINIIINTSLLCSNSDLQQFWFNGLWTIKAQIMTLQKIFSNDWSLIGTHLVCIQLLIIGAINHNKNIKLFVDCWIH